MLGRETRPVLSPALLLLLLLVELEFFAMTLIGQDYRSKCLVRKVGGVEGVERLSLRSANWCIESELQ